MKKYIILFLILSFSSLAVFPQKKSSKKSKSSTESPKKDKDAIKKISEVTKRYKKIEGLFDLYQDTINGSMKMVIRKDQVGKEYIYFSQIADGVLDAGSYRGSYRGSKVFKIEKYFNRIEFIVQNTSSYFNPKSALSKSSSANMSEGVLASLKIEGINKKEDLFLINADNLFLKETFSQIKPPRYPKQSPNAFTLGSLNKEKTKVNSIRNYPKNTDLAIEYVYSKDNVLNGGSRAVSDGRNVSIKVFHSLIEMPENDYKILVDDPRVGYFTTKVTDMTSTSSTPYRDLVHRWNLKKKDTTAAISEPVNPIVWWMENSTPKEWRPIIKEAVLQWNVAFEKAGFKNAVEVKMQPDSANWDAGDIRYNVLRWTSSPKAPFGGYGPSFVNPRTGEILGADIMLEYVHFTNRVLYEKVFDLKMNEQEFNASISHKDINNASCSKGHFFQENTQFGNAVLLSENASDLKLKRLKRESMMALIMHEVGHTLGLNHNMKASQLFSPEQLADSNFIKGKCLTGSVMDYAAINLTRDRSKQGQFEDVAVGPYDIWAIQFAYTSFKSEKQKNDLLNRSTEPELIFGNDADDMRSPGKAIDPRVMVGDLSNDQITYSTNIFELVDEMMKEVKTKFSIEGESYQELRRVYYILNRQRSNAAGVVSRFIGGVYVDRAMVGQKGQSMPYTPVSYLDQKRAMETLSKHVFSPDAFNSPNDLYNYLAMQRRGFDFFRGPEDPKIHSQVLSYQTNILKHILHPNTLQRIVDSELYGNNYGLSLMMTDLNNAIFKKDAQTSVNSFRQNLQVAYTKKLISMVTGNSAGKYISSAKAMAIYTLKNIDKKAINNSGDVSTKAHRLHLRTLIDNALKEIKN